jgi:hypothetical protein
VKAPARCRIFASDFAVIGFLCPCNRDFLLRLTQEPIVEKFSHRFGSRFEDLEFFKEVCDKPRQDKQTLISKSC